MTAVLSPHAKSLLRDIVLTISSELSIDDGLRWHAKIEAEVLRLEDFPHAGSVVSRECFGEVPDNADNLRQVFCRPYRIVYEIIDDEVRILSIRHVRMLVTSADTCWN